VGGEGHGPQEISGIGQRVAQLEEQGKRQSTEKAERRKRMGLEGSEGQGVCTSGVRTAGRTE
jgi:hypothetical protein